MMVFQVKGDTLLVDDLVNTRLRYSLHVKRVRPFHAPPLGPILPPAEIARRDSNEFVVEKILEHRGDPKKRTSLRFQVLWAGYPLSEATWLPWGELRDNSALHEYLRLHHLERLVPKEHQAPAKATADTSAP